MIRSEGTRIEGQHGDPGQRTHVPWIAESRAGFRDDVLDHL